MCVCAERREEGSKLTNLIGVGGKDITRVVCMWYVSEHLTSYSNSISYFGLLAEFVMSRKYWDYI